MKSPHKELATAHEFPCIISDVGEIHSSWIGQKGVSDIVEMRAQEMVNSVVTSKTRELRKLASECLLAFEVSGLNASENPQVHKATELCKSYAPKAVSSCRNLPRRISCNISHLWQKDDHIKDTEYQKNIGQSLAKSTLGEKLVDKITEKCRQPPDVRKTLVCVCYSKCFLGIALYIRL